jgi:hypothetical protein
MTVLRTRSLALVAAALLAGCSTNNYYGDQSGNYAYDNNAAYNDQYNNSQPYDQYADQGYADVDVGVSFGSFQRDLAPYGSWSYHARWGDVWRPRAASGFRPYFNGYWANTREYGWMWVSDDPWDVTYHYGRWVFDPRDGWLWVPGYVWAPSWVVWRSGGGSIGWFPMPPDDYYGNGPYRGNYASFYGYRDWYGPSFSNDAFFSLWIFVGEDRFADRNYRNYVRPRNEYNTLIVNTTEVTNYVTVNNYIVNRSVNVERIERASNRRLETVEARSVMKREARVTPVAAGRQIEQRERRARPIPVANANAVGNPNVRQDVRDARQDARDARQDARDARENVRDARQDTRDARQDTRDARQDVREAVRNGSPQDVRDARQDVRDARGDVRDNRENVRDARQDVRENRQDVRESRQDVRDARQDVREGRQEIRQDRNVRAQPANARQNEAAPAQAGGRPAAREQAKEDREEERDARREEAAERRRAR